jgi:Uma2 family endonuclease
VNAAHVLARTPAAGGFRVADLDALPGDGPRYELIEGCVVVSPPPTSAETAIARWLANAFEVANRGSPLVVDVGQPVRIGDHDEVRPDVVVAHVALAEATPLPVGAVTLVVEVVGQTSLLRDLATKRALYASAGVAAYWIVVLAHDPVRVEIAELRLDPSTGRYTERTPPTSAVFGTDHPWPVTVDVPALAEHWSTLVLDAGRRGEEV